MRLLYKICRVLCLVLICSPIAAQEQTPIVSLTSDAGIVYFLRNHDLWVHDLKTGQDRQITHDKKITTYCISHSGRQIAYVVDEKQLYIYDLVENKEDLLLTKTALRNPSFSPKDDQIVLTGPSTARLENKIHFLSNTYGKFVNHVWLLNIQTKIMTDLTVESPYLHRHATWSPDGKWISFSSFVDPWWTMFRNTEWEVYIMDVNDKEHAEIQIGKGFQSQWVDNNKLVISDNRLFKVYDVQTRTVVKEFKIDDPCSGDYSFGPTIETIYYQAFCGGEGERPVVKIFDLKSRKKKELISDAENPTYIK